MSGLISLIVLNTQIVKHIKTRLEEHNQLSKDHKISKKDGHPIIYTTIGYDKCDALENELKLKSNEVDWLQHLQVAEYFGDSSHHSNKLGSFTSTFLLQNDISISDTMKKELLDSLPKRWSIYPPMILINSNTFDKPVWQKLFEIVEAEIFFSQMLSQPIFKSSHITHIAINKPIIEEDVMRRPFNLIPVYGDFGPEPTNEMYDTPTEGDFEKAFWCTVVQNNIFQTWAPRYTMFSRGNIKEKARILNFSPTSVEGCAVIDLYAGIGYFTLSYLKLKGKLFCWEINPWSVQGLVKGVAQNGYKYKVIKRNEPCGKYDESIDVYIFEESNEYAPQRLQSWASKFDICHINMGLLPTSKPSWPIATELINEVNKAPSTILHIHENVQVDDFEFFLSATEKDLSTLTTKHVTFQHLEKIKTFAPDVWHVCMDFKVT